MTKQADQLRQTADNLLKTSENLLVISRQLTEMKQALDRIEAKVFQMPPPTNGTTVRGESR